MVDKIIRTFPQKIQNQLYDSVYESKILYKEFKQRLNSNESKQGKYKNLSPIIKEIVENEILVNYLNQYTKFKKLYDSHMVERNPRHTHLDLFDSFALSIIEDFLQMNCHYTEYESSD
jgi:hypothetical protein